MAGVARFTVPLKVFERQHHVQCEIFGYRRPIPPVAFKNESAVMNALLRRPHHAVALHQMSRHDVVPGV